MEFAEVVRRRRGVRRFEEGGVDCEVIERIARLAQRTPSAGFSQGQRLVVVVDPEKRREVARIAGEDGYVEMGMGPWISECAAQFVPCVSEEVYHRRYREPDKLRDDGTEIDWPVPFWWIDIGATMQTIMLAAVAEGLGSGFAGADVEPLRAALGIPDEFWPIGVMPVGRRSRTCDRRASSGAGSRSSSSPAGTAGATDPVARRGGGGRPADTRRPRTPGPWRIGGRAGLR